MTRALVTGATGKVGGAVARALLARGDSVQALVRSPERAARLLPAEVELVRGDVTDARSVEAAVAGCSLVFNAMGLPEQWTADPDVFDRVNARGTETVVRAARAAGVARVVHTSTIDVFHAGRGERFDESRVADYPKGTIYERSKQRAEELALAARDGMELVICNPAGVYGPTPASSVSIDDDLFAPLVAGALPALPPGGLGLCFDAGVAEGHLLAAERGRDGERYILCDRHVTLRSLAREVVGVARRGRVPPTLPAPVARAMAEAGEALARTAGVSPLLARGQLHFFRWNAAPDSTKAQEELGWEPTALEDGLKAAVAALG
ncbi:MAG TPA: NAD-dependent epimerase/dehydratase family protein [Thermoleophilaceae bacterium]